MSDYKVYKVGGCVRDTLLGLTPKDIDYVVVGANKKDLTEKGYIQVGKDFPVFLHPETSDEYALARKERKVSSGYSGFDFDCEGVTLEEDLARRDLTINAMAIDENNNIIDPYNGKIDLKNKKLRHVTSAFAEDPLRVLRVARFAARYEGFSVAKETNDLMKKIVERGELESLSPERVWKEVEKAFSEKDPLRFIEVLDDCGALAVVFPEIHKMKGVRQRDDYHAEGDVFVHNNMVLAEAIRYTVNFDNKDKVMVRIGAFFHDVGKISTPEYLEKDGKHHGHENEDVVKPLIDKIFNRMRAPSIYKEFCYDSARLHQKIHAIKQFKSKTVVKTFKNFALDKKEKKHSNYFDNLMIVCRSDATGRLHKYENGEIKKPNMESYEQEYIARKAFEVFSQNYGSKVVKDYKEKNNGVMPDKEFIIREKDALLRRNMSETLNEVRNKTKIKRAP